MAAPVSTQKALPVPMPIYHVIHTLCIGEVDLRFIGLEEKLSEEFFCPRDPEQAKFKLLLQFGIDYPNQLSAFLIPLGREISVRQLKFSVFDDRGNSIGSERTGNLNIDDRGRGVPVPNCDNSAASRSKSWKILMECEYFGVVSTVQPRLAQPNSRFQDEFLHLLRTGDQTDVTFHVQGKKMVAHKVILTTRCEYFRVMFDSGMAESDSKEIEVPDINPRVFQRLLEFIYSDAPPEYDGETSMALLSAADKYGMDNLKKMCETAICSNLNGENVIEALLLAEKHDCSALMARATEVFGSYVRVLKAHENWNKLMESPSLVLKLLEHAYH